MADTWRFGFRWRTGASPEVGDEILVSGRAIQGALSMGTAALRLSGLCS